jgi:hypothetical protein
MSNLKKVGLYCSIALLVSLSQHRPAMPPGAGRPEFWEYTLGEFTGSFLLVAIVGEIILAIGRRRAKKPPASDLIRLAAAW